MFGFTKEKKPVSLPTALEPENPVNYNSVLDYMIGLSVREYDKMLRVSAIYRKANKDAAKILGVKDEPTTQLKDSKPSEEQEDAAMDAVLTGDPAYLEADDADPEAPKKAQAPSSDKKIDVNEG